MGRLGFCSCPGMGAQLWGGYLGEKEGALLGEIWRQAGEAGHCHFPWGKVMARVGVERNSHLRANKARPLVTDMLQGGSNVDLLHSWWEGCGDTQMLRGCPEEGGPRKPRASWDGRLRGLPGGVATCPPRTPVTPGVGETLIWGWAGDVAVTEETALRAIVGGWGRQAFTPIPGRAHVPSASCSHCSCGRGRRNELRRCLPQSLGVGWAVGKRL